MPNGKEHWWHGYPWRMVQTNLREIDMLDIDAEEYVRQLKSFDATVAMINIGGIIASYPTDLPFHFQSPYLSGDSLEKIIAACHEAGIRVIARTDFSKVRRAVYEQHPDWAYRTAEGDIVDYNGDVHACVCGGYQQECAFEIVREIAEKLPVDGLFINMGGFQTTDYSYHAHGFCHCENCKRRFREMHGMDLPRSANMDDPAYRAYLLFQRAVTADYEQRLISLCRALNPELAVNGVDFFRMESNTEYRRALPSWQYSASSNTRRLRGTLGERVISNTTVDFIGYFYRHVAVSPAQQALRLWQNLANLGGLDYYVIGRLDNHADRSGYEPVRRVFQFHKAHQRDYADLRPVAEALLLRSHLWGGPPEESGWVRALTEQHILFDEAVQEDALRGDLRRYHAVILPNIESVSAEMAARLDEYARRGGCVLATGQPGRFDGNLQPREAPPLQCLGVARELCLRRDMVSAMFELSARDKRQFVSFADTDVILFGDQYACNEYAPGIERYMRLIPPQPLGPPERCYTGLRADFPGAVVHPFGAGRGICIPCLPGELYLREGYANTLWFMGDALTQLAGLRSVAPALSEMVEVTMGIARGGSHALVQLVNGTGHFGTSYVQPVRMGDIGLSVPCEKTVRSAVNLTDGSAVPFTQHNGRVELHLGVLDEFACIKLAFE